MSDLARFESFVDKNKDCWMWRGHRLPSGYGIFKFQRKVHRAHRVSWLLFKGLIPDGFVVMHKCDTPACVNPDHLAVGTQMENIQDRVRKKRSAVAFGGANPNARLAPEQAASIRERYIPGKKGLIKRLAAEFGVHRSQILRIGSGESWPVGA